MRIDKFLGFCGNINLVENNALCPSHLGKKVESESYELNSAGLSFLIHHSLFLRICVRGRRVEHILYGPRNSHPLITRRPVRMSFFEISLFNLVVVTRSVGSFVCSLSFLVLRLRNFLFNNARNN